MRAVCQRARWAISGGTAGEIRLMRLLPVARLVVFLRRRNVDAVMHPAMPAGRNARGFCNAVINHPTPRAAFRIGAAFIVDVARLILTDALAVPPGMETRAKRLAVPPSEELDDKVFHHNPRRGRRLGSRG